MSVHYKFKNTLQHEVITFDGLHISVGDLKRSIIERKKIDKTCNFDLQITNAETKETYQHENQMIAKNSSVVVARIPIFNVKKPRTDHFRRIPYTEPVDAPSIDTNASEDDRINAMLSQSSTYYHQSKFIRIRNMSGPVPPTYTCHKCRKTGHHWHKDCTINTRVKHSSGIPRSFMVAVEGPDVPGALLTNTGQYAVPLIDQKAYCEVKDKIKTKFVMPEEPEVEIVPDYLSCLICRQILCDAVVTPCCANCYCDECIRQGLLGSDGHVCPTCGQPGVSPDTLVPNRFLRNEVLKRKVVTRSRYHP